MRNTRHSMGRRRVARLLSDGNISRPHRRPRTLPCPSRKAPYPNHPPLNLPFPRLLPPQSHPRLICIPEQVKTWHIFLLPCSRLLWTTGSHHGQDYHSYYPHLLSTSYFRSLTASCLVSERSLQKMLSLDGLVGKRGTEVRPLVLDFGGKSISSTNMLAVSCIDFVVG